MNQVETYDVEEPEIYLRDYTRIILARKWLVLLTFLIAVLSAIYYIQTTATVYKAKVILSYEDQSTSQLVLEGMQLKNAAFPIDAEQEFLTSPRVVQDILNFLTPVGAGDSFEIFISASSDGRDNPLKGLLNRWMPLVVRYDQSIDLPPPVGRVSVDGLTITEIIDLFENKIHLYDNSLMILSSNLTFVTFRTSLFSEAHVVDSVTLESPHESSLLYLSAVADTVEKAALLANTAAYVYTKQVTERKGRELEFAISFLDRQLTTVERDMESSATELYQFRKEKNLNPGSLSSSKSSNANEQASLTNQLAGYYVELSATADQVEITQAQLKELKREIAETKSRIGESDTLLTTTAELTTEVTRLLFTNGV